MIAQFRSAAGEIYYHKKIEVDVEGAEGLKHCCESTRGGDDDDGGGGGGGG